ncbi:MAG TPA: restriction endonuclease [Pseudomonas oleovorans]|nr:restriction endonuclease [Pseudomonas oleovorans]
MNWKEYQEAAASYFREIGLDANTDVTVQGVRTSHDIDVLVKSHHAGFDITWVVECKHWKERVSKLHVLGLREIVSEVGADRGILLSESGFQSGAIEASNLTNVRLTSLEEMRDTAKVEVFAMRLRELYDEVNSLKARYWALSKPTRIQVGLRPDRCESGYSATDIIELAENLLMKAFRGIYPIEAASLSTLISAPNFPKKINSVESIFIELTPYLTEVEGLLQKAESLEKA